MTCRLIRTGRPGPGHRARTRRIAPRSSAGARDGTATEHADREGGGRIRAHRRGERASGSAGPYSPVVGRTPSASLRVHARPAADAPDGISVTLEVEGHGGAAE